MGKALDFVRQLRTREGHEECMKLGALQGKDWIMEMVAQIGRQRGFELSVARSRLSASEN